METIREIVDKKIEQYFGFVEQNLHAGFCRSKENHSKVIEDVIRILEKDFSKIFTQKQAERFENLVKEYYGSDFAYEEAKEQKRNNSKIEAESVYMVFKQKLSSANVTSRDADYLRWFLLYYAEELDEEEIRKIKQLIDEIENSLSNQPQ